MPTPANASQFYAAVQAAKGTAAASGYIAGLMQQSSLNPVFDMPTKDPEHGAGTSTARTTARKSATNRGSYLATGSARSVMYPSMIGAMLTGAGFLATSAGTTEKTHTFKIANRTAHKWLTIWSQIGGLNRQTVDARLSKLTVEATQDTIRYTAEMRGLTYTTGVAAPASPTAETNIEMIPTIGSLALELWPDDTPLAIVTAPTNTIQRLTLDIANPLDEEDRSLFRLGRADLPQTGLDVTGTIEGIDLTLAQYQAITNGTAIATTPTSNAQIASLTFTLESAQFITGIIPYSFEVTIPHVEITAQDFTAEGTDLIRWSLDYKMIDDVTDPITIVLVNSIAAY